MKNKKSYNTVVDGFLQAKTKHGMTLTYDRQVPDVLADGYNIRYGARSIRTRHEMSLMWDTEVVDVLADGYNISFGARSIIYEVSVFRGEKP